MKLRRTFLFLWLLILEGSPWQTWKTDKQADSKSPGRTNLKLSTNLEFISTLQEHWQITQPKNVKPPAGRRNNANKIKATHANQLCTRMLSLICYVCTYSIYFQMSRGRKKGSKSIRAGGQETVGVICNRYAFICCMVNTKIFKEKKKMSGL